MPRSEYPIHFITDHLHHRPGATEVCEEEEISRVVPIIEGIVAANATVPAGVEIENEANDGRTETTDPVVISVDTRRAAVAEAAVAAGAHAVNDVSGGMFDPGMMATVARAGVPMMMMHMR